MLHRSQFSLECASGRSSTTPPMGKGGEAAQQGSERTGIQVLARAAELLRLLRSAPAGMTQAEITGALGLARTTVHRIVTALCAESLVERVGANGRFRIGPEFIQAGHSARSTFIGEIHGYLQALSAKIDETVDLSTFERGRAVIIDQVVAQHRLCAVSAVGSAFPLHCTANGRALLAVMPLPASHRLLRKELQGLDSEESECLTKLYEMIDTVRESGIAFDLEEHSSGICAVGVAFEGSPLGHLAISIPIPAARFARKKARAIVELKALLDRLKDTFSPPPQPGASFTSEKDTTCR